MAERPGREDQALMIDGDEQSVREPTEHAASTDNGGWAIEAALQTVLTDLRQHLAVMKSGTDPSTFPTLTVIVNAFPNVVDACETVLMLLPKKQQERKERISSSVVTGKYDYRHI